jgi:hypothetical protein
MKNKYDCVTTKNLYSIKIVNNNSYSNAVECKSAIHYCAKCIISDSNFYYMLDEKFKEFSEKLTKKSDTYEYEHEYSTCAVRLLFLRNKMKHDKLRELCVL